MEHVLTITADHASFDHDSRPLTILHCMGQRQCVCEGIANTGRMCLVLDPLCYW